MTLENYETDTFETSAGELKITFIGHGTLMLTFDGKIIHVDPVGSEADYTNFPKADIILITHEHQDHLDPASLELLRTDQTVLVATEICSQRIDGCTVMKNGDAKTIAGLNIEAMPAYNIVHKRADGAPFHPKGDGNGYIINFGDKRVYIGSDTENIPEMEEIRH